MWEDGSTHPALPDGTCPKDPAAGTDAVDDTLDEVDSGQPAEETPHDDPSTPAVPGTTPGTGTEGTAPGANVSSTDENTGTEVDDGTSPTAPAEGDGTPH